MKTLVELDRINDWYLTDKQYAHGYLTHYDVLFEPLRNKKINVFEVGYWFGGSCELWRRYFPQATIRAIDIQLPKNGVKRHTKLQTQFIPPEGRVTLDLVDIKRLSTFEFLDCIPDIAIDDGSHALHDQLYFVCLIYPVLRQGGMLIVEDVQNIEESYDLFARLNHPFKVFDCRSKYTAPDSVFLLFQK